MTAAFGLAAIPTALKQAGAQDLVIKGAGGDPGRHDAKLYREHGV
jgi:hypothetical protein